MPRPKNPFPPVEKKLSLDPALVAQVELALFSDLEGRVPYGAWAAFVEGLIRQHFAAAKRREDLATALQTVNREVGRDHEVAHLRADDLLVLELETLGYDLTAFKTMRKRYA
jgi:hypothetical protein